MGIGYLTGQGGAGFPTGWKEKASGEVFGGAIAKNDPVVLGRYGSWDTAIDRIDDISGITGYVYSIDHYGDYMALATTSTPGEELQIFKRTGVNDAFSLLPSPIGVGTVNSFAVKFSNDGNFLVNGIGSDPYYKIYSRSGDAFTLLAEDTSITLVDSVYDVSFSPDGVYLAMASSSSVYIFKKNGSIYEYLSSIATGLSSVYGCCFSSDGVYLTAVGLNSPYIKNYKRSGDTFTLLTAPTTLPTGAAYNCCFSPDGNYVAVTHATTPWVTIYKRTGDTFAKIANPATLPGGNPAIFNGCQFDSSSNYFALTISSTAPYIFVYKIENDVFIKQPNPATLPSGSIYGVCFSDDDLYLSVGTNIPPYMITYRTETKDIISKMSHFQTNPLSWLPNNDNIGIALQSGAVGETINVNLFPALNNI